jgi:hypothetical protein
LPTWREPTGAAELRVERELEFAGFVYATGTLVPV